MLALYLSSDKAISLGIEPNSKGLYSLTHYEIAEFPEDFLENAHIKDPTKTAEFVQTLLKDNSEYTFLLPESAYYTIRLISSSELSSDEVDNQAKQALGLSSQPLITIQSRIPTASNKFAYLHISLPQTISDSYSSLLTQLSTKPSKIIPESLAAFPVFQNTIGPTEVVAYLPQNNNLIFYDHLGPVSSVSLPGKDKLGKEVEKELGNFYKTHKHKSKRIIAPPASAPFLKGLSIEVLPTNFLLEKKIAEIAPNGLEGIQLDTLNPSLVGLFLLGEDALEMKGKLLPEEKPSIPLVEILKDDTNDKPENSPDSQETSPIISTGSVLSKKKLTIWLTGSFLGGVLATVLVGKFTPMQVANLVKNKPTPTIAAPTMSPSPTPEVISREGLKIEIENGTKTPKLAKKLADFMTTLGYKDIATGNASSQAHPTTLIQVKTGKKAMLDLFKTDLKSQISSPEAQESLSADSNFDGVIIIGEDFIGK